MCRFRTYFLNILPIFALFCSSAVSELELPNKLAFRSPGINPNSSLLPFDILWEFPLGTWVENIAITKDGDALVNLLTSPEVYLVPTCPPHKPILIATIPGVIGLLGITQVGVDVFYVVAGNFTLTSSGPGSYSVWKIDLRGVAPSAAKASKVVDIPQGIFLNGLTVLNPVKGILLIADSGAGVIWSLDVNSKKVAIAINDTTMAPTEGRIAIGINGFRIVGNELFYTNTNRFSFNKVSIDLETGTATGRGVALATNPDFAPDDFTIDFQQNAWVASNAGNQLTLLPGALNPSTTSVPIKIVAGTRDSTTVAGLTAAQFGTTAKDLKRGSLYVTTTGGLLQYIHRNWTTGGTLSRVDLRPYLVP
ncbi:MAG: hypothetical protein Q9214_006857 [Letrouitia sp. 1 TL-2023]